MTVTSTRNATFVRRTLFRMHRGSFARLHSFAFCMEKQRLSSASSTPILQDAQLHCVESFSLLCAVHCGIEMMHAKMCLVECRIALWCTVGQLQIVHCRCVSCRLMWHALVLQYKTPCVDAHCVVVHVIFVVRCPVVLQCVASCSNACCIVFPCMSCLVPFDDACDVLLSHEMMQCMQCGCCRMW